MKTLSLMLLVVVLALVAMTAAPCLAQGIFGTPKGAMVTVELPDIQVARADTPATQNGPAYVRAYWDGAYKWVQVDPSAKLPDVQASAADTRVIAQEALRLAQEALRFARNALWVALATLAVLLVVVLWLILSRRGPTQPTIMVMSAPPVTINMPPIVTVGQMVEENNFTQVWDGDSSNSSFEGPIYAPPPPPGDTTDPAVPTG